MPEALFYLYSTVYQKKLLRTVDFIIGLSLTMRAQSLYTLNGFLKGNSIAKI